MPNFDPVRGLRVKLRPLREDEFPQVWEALQRRRSGPTRLDSRSAERLRKRIRRSGRFAQGAIDLGIEVEGRLVGDIQARHPLNAMPPGVFELGIELYDTADHGRGYGREAVGLLTSWLFERANAGRVQAGTAVGNIGMRRVLERLGYSFEGVMRGFMPGPTVRADYALYGVTRADWEATVGALSVTRQERPPRS